MWWQYFGIKAHINKNLNEKLNREHCKELEDDAQPLIGSKRSAKLQDMQFFTSLTYDNVFSRNSLTAKRRVL